MRKIYIVLAVLIFSIYIQAQPSNTAETKKTDIEEVKVTPKNNGKVVIPPEKLKPINIPKIAIPIVIDGKPDEESWKNAAVFKDFYQTSPGDNIAPSKPTEVYVMYDEKNLYVAFKCWDEKDKINATVAKRDEVFGEDNVNVARHLQRSTPCVCFGL